MIRVLMWKEYREHRAIWLSLAIVGGAGLYALSRLIPALWGLSYDATRDSLQSVTVLFAWVYGLVCGSMLMANEVETGAMTFLEQLPVRRLELWLVKCLFGLLLLALQVAVLIGFILVLGISETPRHFLATVLAMIYFGLLALAWGMLFSARGENVLNVIGLAIVGQLTGVVATLLLFFLLTAPLLLMGWRETEIVKDAFVCLAPLGLLVVPFLGSARLFTRLDCLRRNRSDRNVKQRETLPMWSSWLRLLWLSYARMRRLLLGLTFVALLFGLALPWLGPLGWPTLTLLLGILCGVTVWSDEQFSASFRFLGDQRFPLGRVWLVKVGSRFALAVFIAFVLLTPSLVLALIHHFTQPSSERLPFVVDLLHCDLLGPIVPVWLYLSLWLLYGFATGQLCGLLFRKSLVAGTVSLGTATLLVCLWVPSLLGMGLHFWQIASVPMPLLMASWLLMPAWTADRLLARGTFVRVFSALFVAGLWTAGGIGYRIAEIPNEPEPFDMSAFVAGVPSLDEKSNPAGLEIRGAWKQVEERTAQLSVPRAGKPLLSDVRTEGGKFTFDREIDAVLQHGWPKDASPALGDWLNTIFQPPNAWYSVLLTASRQPLGAVEDTKLITVHTRLYPDWSRLSSLNRVLAARGLQRQAEGDPHVFLDNLRISLALSRNFRNHTRPILAQIGLGGEVSVLESALDRWLDKLPNDAAVLEQLRDLLLEHEAQRPKVADVPKAQYLIAQNSLESESAQLIESELRGGAAAAQQREELRQAQCEAAALFWRIPWEHERHARILRMAARDEPLKHSRIVQWGGTVLGNLIWRMGGDRSDKHSLVVLHAAQLKAALRLYQAKNGGRLPATLKELTPHYLPAIPIDPYDGRPFRYRISSGEQLVWPKESALDRGRVQVGPDKGVQPPKLFDEPKRPVLAGQAILWSVGLDGRDHGGKRQEAGSGFSSANSDLIYLLPLPAH
jgi:hypothetical protein